MKGTVRGGPITVMFSGRPSVIPTEQPPPNDMRPRQVDRAKVKAGRKTARRNIWSMGGSSTSTRCVRCRRYALPWWRRWRMRWFLWWHGEWRYR